MREGENFARFLFIVVVVLVVVTLSLAFQLSERNTELRRLKFDAITKGYAEWCVDIGGNVKFNWANRECEIDEL